MITVKSYDTTESDSPNVLPRDSQICLWLIHLSLHWPKYAAQCTNSIPCSTTIGCPSRTVSSVDAADGCLTGYPKVCRQLEPR